MTIPQRSQLTSPFQGLIVAAALIFLTLPFTTTFNEFLTSVVISAGFYRYIEVYVAPPITRMAAAILQFAFGLNAGATGPWLVVEAGGRTLSALIIWNCVGWQSLILYGFTLLTGLRGPFTLKSKLLCVAIGFQGTLIINILRIVAVVVFAFFFGQLSGIIFHDYAGTILVLVWLFGFWKLANRYLLTLEVEPDDSDSAPIELHDHQMS